MSDFGHMNECGCANETLGIKREFVEEARGRPSKGRAGLRTEMEEALCASTSVGLRCFLRQQFCSLKRLRMSYLNAVHGNCLSQLHTNVCITAHRTPTFFTEVTVFLETWFSKLQFHKFLSETETVTPM